MRPAHLPLRLSLRYKFVECEPRIERDHITIVWLWARRGTDQWYWRAVRRWPWENREIDAVALEPIVGRLQAELRAYDAINGELPTELLEQIEEQAPWTRGMSWRNEDPDR